MVERSSKRIILLASANSYRNSPFSKAAQKLSLEIIYGEDIPTPLQSKGSNDLALDYRDIKTSTKKILKFTEKNPIDAILGLDDSGTLIASSASEELGLPHNSINSALAARDKSLMRKTFLEHNVPSPQFHHYRISDDLNQIAENTKYPCVIKPTTLSGSRGVMRADSPTEFLERINRLKPLLQKERCDEFLVEDFIPGVEVALEGLLNNGEMIVLALFDKPDPLDGPFFEETIYVTPSRLPEAAQKAVIDTAEQAARSLGLIQGPIHAELRYNDEGAWMVEIAGRSIGGLCSQTLQFQTEQTLEELILRQITGMDLSGAKRTNQADGVMMIPIPEKGILKNISGIEDAEKIQFISNIEITARLNYPLLPLPEGDSYLGFIFATADTPEQAENALRQAHSKLKFSIMPEITLEKI